LVLRFAIAGFKNLDTINTMQKHFNINLLVFVSLYFLSCTNNMKEVMAMPSNKLSPSQIGDSVTLLYTDSASLKVMLKANRMLLFNKNVSEPFTILPKGFFITFFDQEEKISTTLKANYGIRYDLTKRMEAKYAVEVINKKGEKLETERLVWDEATKRIYTDADLKITTATQIIKGKGLNSNEDFTKYEIKEVTGTINIKENGL
jgi:LPS export ABC transporter protein LptC